MLRLVLLAAVAVFRFGRENSSSDVSANAVTDKQLVTSGKLEASKNRSQSLS